MSILWACRSHQAESYPIIFFDGTMGNPCSWHRCGDENLQDELVLVYHLEKTSDLKKTFILYDDRFFQKLTASGKACSGKVGDYVMDAIPGTYNQNGTLKSKYYHLVLRTK